MWEGGQAGVAGIVGSRTASPAVWAGLMPIPSEVMIALVSSFSLNSSAAYLSTAVKGAFSGTFILQKKGGRETRARLSGEEVAQPGIWRASFEAYTRESQGQGLVCPESWTSTFEMYSCPVQLSGQRAESGVRRRSSHSVRQLSIADERWRRLPCAGSWTSVRRGGSGRSSHSVRQLGVARERDLELDLAAAAHGFSCEGERGAPPVSRHPRPTAAPRSPALTGVTRTGWLFLHLAHTFCLLRRQLKLL